MRPVNCFLFREGNTDDYFLPKLLERALMRLCGDADVEVAPIIPLRVEGPLVAGVCAAAQSVVHEADLFFCHYDGSPSFTRETAKYWNPLCVAWSRLNVGQEVVRVVPVREMEAWAVADLAALSSVSRVKRDAEIFADPLLADPEKLLDPKQTLRNFFTPQGRRRRPADPESYLSVLADKVSLDVLRRLPSFNRWEVETSQVLRQLRIIR